MKFSLTEYGQYSTFGSSIISLAFMYSMRNKTIPSGHKGTKAKVILVSTFPLFVGSIIVEMMTRFDKKMGLYALMIIGAYQVGVAYNLSQGKPII